MDTYHLREVPAGTGTGFGHENRGLFAFLPLLVVTFLVGLSDSTMGQYTALKLPEGYVQVQADIITTKSAAAELLNDFYGIHPFYVYAPSRLWPGRVVPFRFGASVTAAQRTVFLAAMAMWTNSFPGVTTISFAPQTTEAGFLSLVVGDPGGFVGGSTDYVGYSGGTVTITMHSNAVFAGVIAHEMGHALGLWHEQSRSDRVAFVTVNYAQIQNGMSSQFDIEGWQAFFGTYDYDSIMHYGACDFSICEPLCTCGNASCRTITTFFPAQQCNIGQLNHLSAMDKRSMAFMYGPPDWQFLYPKSPSAADGSFQQPFQTVSQAVVGTVAGATLWLGPGGYPAAGMTISKPMTLRAAIPDLQLQGDGSLGPSPAGYATLQ